MAITHAVFIPTGGANGNGYINFPGSCINFYASNTGSSPVIRNFTISVWVRNVGSSGFGVILNKGASRNTSDFSLEIKATTPTLYSFIMVINGALYSAQGTLPVGNNNTFWHHIAYTFDSGVGRTVLYLDEVKIDDSVIGGVLGNQNVPWRIGRYADSSQPYEGDLDDLHFYDRALDHSEVIKLRNSGLI